MDDLLKAAVLGIVQGLTEFLPVSSSGHLILVPRLFGWEDQGLAFDVGLHGGTLLALLVYFWRDWCAMLRGAVSVVRPGAAHTRDRTQARLLALIVAGSVPAAVVGLLFNSWIEANVRQPWLVAITLAVVGGVMLAAERFGRPMRSLHDIRAIDVAAIGLAQACALIPGVSRSGATISAGLFLGLTRDSAARFAFLLGTPAFIGAALLKASDLASESGAELGELAFGFALSAVVGFAAIHFLLRYLRTHSLLPFVIYRWAVAALTLIVGAIRIA
ncbi:MAG: undecaprenyl-diphosphatase UppP [Dehalococcoidia bacterium]